jgi:hypothetical protein
MKKKKSINDRIAEAVEMELAQAKAIGWSEEGRRLDVESTRKDLENCLAIELSEILDP